AAAGTAPQVLTAVWGSGQSDVWAVGTTVSNTTPEILRWNGTAWAQVAATGTDHISLNAVWGTGPSDVWAAGNDHTTTTGAVLHWDGSAWTAPASWTSAPPYVNQDVAGGVWGSGPNDVWVMQSEQIQLWDGSTWANSLVMNPAYPSLAAMWGSSATDVWAVG